MYPLTPLPTCLADGPFSVHDADAFGIPRSRLRRSDLETPTRGVRVPRRASPRAAEDDPWAEVRRFKLDCARILFIVLEADAAFSHITAALAHGFPLRPGRLIDTQIHVTAPSDLRRRRRYGVKVHPLPKDSRRVVADRLRVTHPVDTWCALSALLSVSELVEIGDHLVRRQRPDATLDELHRAVRAYAGRHGVKRLRAALALVRARTDSCRETQVRLILISAGLAEPAVNIPIRDAAGHYIKLGDMVYKEFRVLVEYDGEQHRTDSRQYAKDARDLERLTAAGWIVVRVRKGDLRNPGSILSRVQQALRSRGYPGPSTVTDATRRVDAG